MYGKMYIDFVMGKFFKFDEVDFIDLVRLRVVRMGEVVGVSYEKMFKSKYNGVDFIDVINLYGVDVIRVYMFF